MSLNSGGLTSCDYNMKPPAIRQHHQKQSLMDSCGLAKMIAMEGIYVFLRDAALPTVQDWNRAIKENGFNLVLDSFDLRNDDGYLPAWLRGEESGFEWYLEPVANMDEDPEMDPPFLFKAFIGDCDLAASLKFISQANEDVTSSIAAAVLAKMTDGVFWDPGDPELCGNQEPTSTFLRGDEAIALARKRFANLDAV